jgi:hypothetical protein
MRRVMKHYTVVSGEIGEVVPVTDYGLGPTEYFCCVATVEAENQAKAKALALKTDDFSAWRRDTGGENPFTGLKVYDNICPHGKCQCEMCCPEGEPTCPPCLVQFNKEIEEQLAAEAV